MLSRVGIPHEVLNAKHHQREAEIVAQAGRKGAVTIATNMAGRGTDILLGGNPSFMALKYLRQLECEGKPKYDDLIISMATEKVIPSNLAPDLKEKVLEARDEYLRFSTSLKVTDKEHNEVVEYGGLHVIGTERHESRRIDNQLRGRAGRQEILALKILSFL